VPGIWVFILSILGILLVVVIVAYLSVKYLQKRRREDLRRRIVAGEIDLEYLGIKRLVVPPHVLVQLPLYMYPDLPATKPPSDSDKTPPDTVVVDNPVEPAPVALKPDVDAREASALRSTHSEQDEDGMSAILEEVWPSSLRREVCRLTFSQLTCAICLEDFVPGSSLVRELPCTHIFHPECIDPFLMRDSSLCPVCKKSVLPPTFVSDQVTNYMVRREQRMRRVQRRTWSERYGIHRGIFDRVRFGSRSLFAIFTVRRPGFHRNALPARNMPSFRASQLDSAEGSVEQRDQSSDLYDAVRREMIQRRAMALLGPPLGPPRTDIDERRQRAQRHISRPPNTQKCESPDIPVYIFNVPIANFSFFQKRQHFPFYCSGTFG
jgi:hypothetical protein